MLVAIALPFFGALLSFLGGFAFAPTTYWVRNYSLCFEIIVVLEFYAFIKKV